MDAKDLRDPVQNRFYYEKLYSTGYMDFWDPREKQRAIDFVKQCQPPLQGSMIDYGCGTGEFSGALALAFPGLEVVGCDSSRRAVELATGKTPHLRFYTLPELRATGRLFDALFTHHVIEHFSDLNDCVDEMVEFLKPTANMFHILPCADPGGLEHRIASSVRDGINSEFGNRYFFEDHAHLRRMTTIEIETLFLPYGFVVCRNWYDNRFWGAIDWVTAHPTLAFKIAPVTRSRTVAASSMILAAKIAFAFLCLCRFPAAINRLFPKHRFVTSRLRRAVIKLSRSLSPLFTYPDRSLMWLADQEWKNDRNLSGGNMYVHFRRTSA